MCIQEQLKTAYLIVLKVGLDHVFERYAERFVCHAIQHKKVFSYFLAVINLLKRNR